MVSVLCSRTEGAYGQYSAFRCPPPPPDGEGNDAASGCAASERRCSAITISLQCPVSWDQASTARLARAGWWDRCCSCPSGTPSLGAVGNVGLRIHLLSRNVCRPPLRFSGQVTEQSSRRDHRHVPLGAVVARSAIYFAVLNRAGLLGGARGSARRRRSKSGS